MRKKEVWIAVAALLAGAAGPPEETVVFNGSGINPLILAEHLAPRLGKPWMVKLDCRGTAPGKPSIIRIAFVPVPDATRTRWGEVLVSLTAGTGVNFIGPSRGAGMHPLTRVIPRDPAVAGFPFQVQGFCSDRPRGFLSNGLASTVGR